MANKQEQLEIAIVIAAKGALEELQNLQAGTERWEKVLAEVKTLVQTFSTTAKVSFSEAADAVGHAAEKTELLNKALAENAALVTAKAGGMKSMADDAETRATKARLDLAELELARKQGLANWQSQTTDMMFAPRDLELRPSQQTGRFAGQAGKYDTGAGKIMYNDLKQVGPLLEKLPEQTKNAAQGFNILRSAMGFMVAMGMSAVIQGITAAFAKMVDSAKQAEKAIFNLVIAEKALSRAGVEISPDDFKAMEEAVKATGIAISDIDITKLIANTASGTRDLKLTVEQLQDLSVATAAIAYANGKTIEEVQNTIQTSLTTSGRGLKPLDIPVDAAIIKEKALSAQLVENAAAYDALTAAEKQKIETDALLLIISDNANQILAETNSLSGSLTESSQELSVAWENLTTVGGQVLKPLLLGLMNILTIYTQVWIGSFKIIGVGFAEFVSGLVGGIAVIGEALKGNVKSIQDAKDVYKDFYTQQRQTMYDLLFPGGLSPIELGTASTGVVSMDIGKMLGVPSTTQANEPTAANAGGIDSESNQNLLDAQAEFNQAILDAELKLGQDLEDAKIDYERKLYDIDVEYKAKRLDLENDYAKKVADINRSYQDKIAEINQRQQEDKARQRNDELQKEREFQNQMLVLKENFLMALDDALHARDARQILKLIKNYELDKAQAERKHSLDVQSAREDAELRQKSYAEDRKKAEADRKAKLAEAQRDYADKIAKLNADEAAEREAARLANERKIEDLHRSMQDRLEVIAAGLVEEYKLTEENLKGIVGLYLRYYNNATQILAAMRAQIAGTMQMMAQMQSYQYSAPIGPVFGGGNLPSSSNLGGSGGSGGSGNSGRPMANGGTIIANKPTTVTFGERGLEAGTFMPLGRVGKDVNSLFSNVSGAGDGSGKVSIELLLSPDLESRIVSNTLNKTAEVFTRTQRSKR